MQGGDNQSVPPVSATDKQSDSADIMNEQLVNQNETTEGDSSEHMYYTIVQFHINVDVHVS